MLISTYIARSHVVNTEWRLFVQALASRPICSAGEQSELEQRVLNELLQVSKRQPEDANPEYLGLYSDALQLHCTDYVGISFCCSKKICCVVNACR